MLSTFYPRLLFSITFILFCFWAKATHNRAGEITYKQVGEKSIEVTVTTYTKSSSQVDRDSILVSWGDSTTEYIKRSNGQGEELDNNVKRNTYTAIHVYPARSTYTISMTDPNRVGEIQNLNFPNSENLKFHIFITFSFTNKTFNGSNNSVVLNVAPIDIACIDQPFIHIPGASDPDGDSLAFELSVPYDESGNQIDDYQYPNEIIPTNNFFSFDITNGEIYWNSPKKTGEYNVAFLVKEYRNGVLLTTMIRDMQIFVFNCDNEPPKIDIPEEICVVAGETVTFDVNVTDADPGQKVKLQGIGVPFQLSVNPAILDGPTEYTESPLKATFTWTPRCEDISDNAYEVVFRAVDNFFISPLGDVSGLADLKSIKIKVVGPAPENLEAESDKNKIYLTWDLPYACEITENMYFQGFSVWRSEQSVNMVLDTCNPGIKNTPYINIGFPQINITNGKYSYEDAAVEKGKTYCYRVVAEFAKVSDNGFPYNFVQSLVSNEVCLQLARDIPLLTKVSVRETSITNGIIDIEFIKPDPDDLDTLMVPGPYKYQIERSEDINGSNFQEIPGATFTTDNFAETIDLSYVDMNLNTVERGYNYRIAFYADGIEQFYDYSPSSSSVFLNILSSDQTNQLEWASNTSWNNYQHYINRFNNATLLFELIDSTKANFYQDQDLINGLQYCYIVETKGSYQIPGLEQTIFNFSNESCGVPIDTIPPCSPKIQVTNPCFGEEIPGPDELFSNLITWKRVDFDCINSGDIDYYKIYFKPTKDSEYELVDEIDDIQVISATHIPENGLNGCYVVSAVDTVGNESAFSNEICIEDCPSYTLPNAFTPNGDGDNDIFKPILNRFVSRIDLKVYNEWGQKVFETQDPAINWDGKNFNSIALNDGVYYYTCEIFQNSLDNGETTFDFLKGYIYILNSK